MTSRFNPSDFEAWHGEYRGGAGSNRKRVASATSPKESQSFRDVSAKGEADPEIWARAKEALRHIPSDERDTWMRIGMSLKTLFGDAAFDLWDAWSETTQAGNYDPASQRQQWESFQPGDGTTQMVNGATLWKLAREGGWGEDTPSQPGDDSSEQGSDATDSDGSFDSGAEDQQEPGGAQASGAEQHASSEATEGPGAQDDKRASARRSPRMLPPPPRLDLDAALPPEIAGACCGIARWIQIAVEAVVTCFLAHASAAIGNSRWVAVRGFYVPLSLQFVTSILAGSGKSEIRRYFRCATQKIEARIMARRAEAEREAQEYADKLAAWKADQRNPKARNTAGPRPEPPKPSPHGGVRVTYCLSEANLEGVVETLLDTPRGLMWATDEAHEVIGMLGVYGDGKRSLDAARLRKLTESQPTEAHRAKSNTSPIRRLQRPFLGMDLDVQPGVFVDLFMAEDRVSGFTARLLIHEPRTYHGRRKYVTPPPQPSPKVLALIEDRLGELFDLEFEVEDDGTAVPEWLPLHPDAELAWAEELERLERLYSGASDERAGALGHARGRILRLAGVLCLLRDPRAQAVSKLDVERAIVLMRYHLAHADRLAQRDEETEEERDLRELEELIRRRHGGEITARELRNAKHCYRNPGAAEAALDELVHAGRGSWYWRAPGPRGGAPVRVFRLAEEVTGPQTEPEESSGGVGGPDQEDGPSRADDWEEVA